ncbi:hypothetical protein Cs7R123_05450 [Catellatospora sp. TT07R-123]|uniref:HAD-IIIC family phosphatase n=1 Tax=Catellatospora sp. TT07R-123 TaxID=2733863 RepID=UPI001AFECF07|nr:HAD-IIIC family phosphatase [Catellatospora sp. TT07R-123]GHJ43203.1 hypothetical protein Cs7R123_05450 [Catellatospora sp. TT07R-123]
MSEHDLTGDTVKCLVWDLDETLWRGVLLEDGVVSLPDEIRRVVVELDRRGILQSVASRNDAEQAMSWLARLGVAEYFVLPRIGWGAKSESVRAIADELGFAYRSMAFIDDHPAEQAEVAHHLPQVRCYAAHEAVTLPSRAEFCPPVVAPDAHLRRQRYQTSLRRQAARAGFAGPDEDFLRTLELRLHIREATAPDLLRVEELTLRTSQMNATGVHYPLRTLRGLLDDSGHLVLVCTLEDRFGQHGTVGIALVARHARSWHLKLLTTSCRVIPYGVGGVLLGWLIDQAASAGVHVAADFVRTERNRMMEVAYRFAGFTAAGCACLDDLPGGGGVQRLHLVATHRTPPASIHVTAQDLA